MFPILPIPMNEMKNEDETVDPSVPRVNSDLNYNLESYKASQTSEVNYPEPELEIAPKSEEDSQEIPQPELPIETSPEEEKLNDGSVESLHSFHSKPYKFRSNKRDTFSRFLLVSDESLRICEFILQRVANGQNELKLATQTQAKDHPLNKLSGSILIIAEFLESFRDPISGTFTEANSDKTFIGCLLKKEFKKLDNAVTLTATSVRTLRKTFEKIKLECLDKSRDVTTKAFKNSQIIADRIYKLKMVDFEHRFKELQMDVNKRKNSLSSESLNADDLQTSTSFISLSRDGLVFKDREESNSSMRKLTSLTYLDRMQIFSKVSTSTVLHFKLTRERLYKMCQFLKEDGILWANFIKMVNLIKDRRKPMYPTEEGRLLCAILSIVTIFNRFGKKLSEIEKIIIEAHFMWRQISPNGKVLLGSNQNQKYLNDFIMMNKLNDIEFKLEVFNSDNYDLEREMIKTIFSFRILEKATFPQVIEQRFEILENEAVKFELKIQELKSPLVELKEEDVELCSDAIQEIFKLSKSVSEFFLLKKCFIGNFYKELLYEIRKEPEKREFLTLNFWIVIFYEILGNASSDLELKKHVFRITKQCFRYVDTLPSNLRKLKRTFKIPKGQVKRIGKSVMAMAINSSLSDDLMDPREPYDMICYLKESKSQLNEDEAKEEELSIYFTQEEGIFFSNDTNRIPYKKLNAKSRLNVSEVIVCNVASKLVHFKNSIKELKALFHKSESMEDLRNVRRGIEKYKKRRRAGNEELLLVNELEEIILSKIAVKLEKEAFALKSLLKQLIAHVKKGKKIILALAQNLPKLKLKNELKFVENVESRNFIKSLNLEYLKFSVNDPTLKSELSKYFEADFTKKFDMDDFLNITNQ